jgi:hypothetical protein
LFCYLSRCAFVDKSYVDTKNKNVNYIKYLTWDMKQEFQDKQHHVKGSAQFLFKKYILNIFQLHSFIYPSFLFN